MGITATTILRTHRVTVTRAAHSWIPHVLGWVAVEEGSAELTVAPSGVVLTPITHAPAYVPRCQVNSHVKVAAVSVPVALTLSTGMSMAVLSGMPGKVLIEILALLTVESTGIVLADTGPMYHSFHMGRCPWCGCTLGGVSIAEAVATDDKLIESIIVFFPDLLPWVKQVVSQCVKPG